ncbi:MAG: type I CRISPR-associated protein Cas7, partial [Leptospiraceae bacterium]|nr:type I CRISPR-associated protein Cas7 [Leptospiraceae bacterium]
MSEIKNRSEILFLYDCKDANPNGDPLDENKPRIDEERGINIVTDVRLKRTIRDYIMSKDKYKEAIAICIKRSANGEMITREERFKEERKNLNKLLDKYVDLRLFGATLGMKEKSDDSDAESSGSRKGS